MPDHREDLGAVRWWWGPARRKAARWAAAMERQAEDRRIRTSTPTAVVLDIVHNSTDGWKWLVWDYDPDGVRLLAGQVEGVLAPHGMKGGYPTALDALTAGLGAIRNSGWDGDVVLREKVPTIGSPEATPDA